ncbi:MAG: helix-turn-helix transcriptional regulator [Thermoleophilia bacterium]|nr:helix-turn-helix transcriptional regulator [Thermoleophilia bacterium]
MTVRLRELIEAHNEALPPGEPPMTQRRLADATGIDEGLVSRHISGDHLMLYETALRYARFLGVSPARVDDRFSEGQELATSTTRNSLANPSLRGETRDGHW